MSYPDLPMDLKYEIVHLQPASARILCQESRAQADTLASKTIVHAEQFLLQLFVKIGYTHISVVEWAERVLAANTQEVYPPELFDEGYMFDTNSNEVCQMLTAYKKEIDTLYRKYHWHLEFYRFLLAHTLMITSFAERHHHHKMTYEIQPSEYCALYPHSVRYYKIEALTFTQHAMRMLAHGSVDQDHYIDNNCKDAVRRMPGLTLCDIFGLAFRTLMRKIEPLGYTWVKRLAEDGMFFAFLRARRFDDYDHNVEYFLRDYEARQSLLY